MPKQLEKPFCGGSVIIDSKELALACARIADEKKAVDPVILDIAELTSVADYFFICHAENHRQMQAIAHALKKELREMGVRALGIEGDSANSNWVLVDLGDVVAHIFLPESRQFYDLERLWSDAGRIEFATAGG